MRPLYLAGALAAAVLLSAAAVAGTGTGVNSFDLFDDETPPKARMSQEVARAAAAEHNRITESFGGGVSKPSDPSDRILLDSVRQAARYRDDGAEYALLLARTTRGGICNGTVRDADPETASFGCVWTLDKNALDPSVFRRGNTIVAYGLAPKDADTIMLQRADGSSEKLPVKDGMILVGYNAAEVGVSPPDRIIALRDGEQFRCAQLGPLPRKDAEISGSLAC
jgi:hypothetical protein